jgi:hypothetical protein
MKKNYTVVFSQNNLNKEENYFLDLAEIEENEKYVKKAIEKIVISPRQKVIDNIMKFAREGKC